LIVHGDGLRTSNPVRGAEIAVVTGRDGRVSHFLFESTINVLIESICCFHDVIFISFLTCCFHLSPLLCCSGGEETNPISYDAEGSAVKDELEGLSSIATLQYMRSALHWILLVGCTWTISFPLRDTFLVYDGVEVPTSWHIN